MANVWVSVPPGGDATTLVRNVLTKAAADTVTAQMDFGDHPELIAGATVSNCTVSVTPSGPTINTTGTVNAAGYAVSTTISGGTSGTTYGLTFTATLNDGSTILARVGSLQVF